MEQTKLVLDRVSWDDLRLFAATARHASFRKAALALGLASSTLTRRMERLESDLGVRLFNRVPEGVSLTREGVDALVAAEQMEQASHSLRAYLDRDISSRGLVRCAITEGLGTFWLMGRLAEFNRTNPFTVVDLKCSMEITDVMRHECDVAVQLVRPKNPELMVKKIGRIHAYPFAAPRYIDTYGAPSSVDELVNHKLIDQTSVQADHGVLQKFLGPGLNLDGLVALRTNASTAHYYAVEMGLGIGLLPTYAGPLGATVVPIDIDRRNEIDIWLTYHPDVRSVPRIALFIDWLKDQFDPRKYPWFRDEFIHPRKFATWTPPAEDVRFDDLPSIVINPPFAADVA
jgi:DNA-binding transcriptional LysR family regulator